jgi:hypothetical protein
MSSPHKPTKKKNKYKEECPHHINQLKINISINHALKNPD